jgi:hypothetical protein
MAGLIQRVMRRTTKELVQDQLNLPPQTQSVSFLRFSGIESFNYNKKSELIMDEFKSIHSGTFFFSPLLVIF